MRKYALGHSFDLSDLFIDFNIKSLKIKPEECEEMIGYKSKRELAKAVYSYSIKLVLDSLILEDKAFKLPSGAKSAKIRLRRVEGDEFTNSRKNGKFRGVDFIATNLTGYQPELEYQVKDVQNRKTIYLNKEYRKLIEKRINDGEHYTQ